MAIEPTFESRLREKALPLLVVDEATHGGGGPPLAGRFALQTLVYLAQSERPTESAAMIAPGHLFPFDASPLGPSSLELLRAINFLYETGLVQIRSGPARDGAGMQVNFQLTMDGAQALSALEQPRSVAAQALRSEISRFAGMDRRALLGYLLEHHPASLARMMGLGPVGIAPIGSSTPPR
jgi:hypothetical protein